MPKTRIFVFGDSHTRSLLHAIDEGLINESQFDYSIHWMLTEKNGVVRGDLKIEDAYQTIKSLSGKDIVAISLLGTAHNIFGLIQHEQPYVLFETGSQPLACNAGTQVIPRNAMKDMFDSWSRKNTRINKLKDCSSVRVFHLMTPPPKQDNEYIKSRTSRYRDKNVADVGISTPELRLSLWKLEKEVLQVLCSEWGIGLIAPPVESMNDEGFLKPEYYGNDATHANAEYGKLVLKQLEEVSAG